MSASDYGELDDRGLPAGKAIRAGLEVGPFALRDMLAAGDRLLLVDVREPDEWRICRLEGAELVPLGEVEERADEVLDMVEDRGGDADETPVIVYCHHGVRSLTAAAVLQAKGVRGARSLAGGIDLWAVSVDPGVARY